jgi:hypothetical protein
MNLFDAYNLWWADPSNLIIPAGKTEEILDWLTRQTPDTWHQVASSWNYDWQDDAVAWILEQDACDKGTAAQVFRVLGGGYWLTEVFNDPAKYDDEGALCKIILKNWHRYKSGELKPIAEVPAFVMKMVEEKGDAPPFKNTPLKEIMTYSGTRGSESMYGSEDGKIVVTLDYWMESKGYELTK